MPAIEKSDGHQTEDPDRAQNLQEQLFFQRVRLEEEKKRAIAAIIVPEIKYNNLGQNSPIAQKESKILHFLKAPFRWIGHLIRKCLRSIKATIMGYFGLGDSYYVTLPIFPHDTSPSIYLPRAAAQTILERIPIYSIEEKKSTIERSARDELELLDEEKKRDRQESKSRIRDEKNGHPTQELESPVINEEQMKINMRITPIHSLLSILPNAIQSSIMITQDHKAALPHEPLLLNSSEEDDVMREPLSAFLNADEESEASNEDEDKFHECQEIPSSDDDEFEEFKNCREIPPTHPAFKM